MEKDNNLETSCMFEGFGNGKPNLDSSPCLDCIKDCYRPKNMNAEKEGAYMSGCKSINSYSSKYE